MVPGDVEKGSKTAANPNLGEILPMYRQDSHLTVHGGSHSFPGEGTYLIKFDNSYSLWRNKTLYYRVYYSAWGTKCIPADECFDNIYFWSTYINICIYIYNIEIYTYTIPAIFIHWFLFWGKFYCIDANPNSATQICPYLYERFLNLSRII